MRKLYLILFLISFIFASSEDDFLKTLNEVSEIATKTKLNIDKTPSTVEVINRDFIVKSGARTLLDLLQYLPGIEISMSASGKKEIIVRGNKSTYRDKIKFLINGEEVTNNLYSNQFYYYNFPANLIKRVEFTKTPDAVLYGDKAFVGVINIITLDELDDNQFSFYQSNKKQTTLTVFDKLNDNLLIDAHYLSSNPSIEKINTYLVDVQAYNYKPVRYNRPNALEKESGLGVRYKKENSTISYRIQYLHKGNFFGVVNLPPLDDDKHVNLIHQYLNYNYSKFITDEIKNSFNIGAKHYQWKGEFRVLPVDFNFSNPNSDEIMGANIKEYEFYLKNRTTYTTDKHIINVILETKYARLYKSDYETITPTKTTYSNLFTKSNINRIIFSLAFEDLFIIKDDFSVIYGGRYSHYNDFGGDFSYKLGSVYNLNDKTTFKILFNTAFRAPSWVELYSQTAASFNGNPNLKAEKIKMLELSWLQKITDSDKLKFTLYRGLSKNYIGRDFSLTQGKKIYQNLGDLLIRGYEVSYKKVYEKGNFNINYSFNNNKALFSSMIKNVDFYKYTGIRKHLIKGWNIYNFNPRFSFFSGVVYGSKINLPMGNEHNYFSLNTNLNYKVNNLSFIFGVDNLTNHKNSYLSIPSDLIANKYFFIQDDAKLPLEGRKFYIKLVKKW